MTLIAIVFVSILSHSLLHFLLCCSLSRTPLVLSLSHCNTHTQPNSKPLHYAAYVGQNLCVALLLLADDSILRVKNNSGWTPVDMARDNKKDDTAVAMEKWASGDKAGALRDLGAAHLISSLTSQSTITTATTTGVWMLLQTHTHTHSHHSPLSLPC